VSVSLSLSLSALNVFDVWQLQCGLDIQRQVAGSCERSNELSGSMNFGELRS